MPSVWEWKDWCVDDMTQGGIGEVWAEVFKRHPKDKKNHTKTINMGEHKIQKRREAKDMLKLQHQVMGKIC